MLLLILLHIYFVSFLDKPEKTAPQLSPRAVEQRQKWHIPTDQMDYPVSPLYLSQIEKAGAKVHHKSRWFNGVTCEMDKETAAKVAELPFVTAVEVTRDDTKPKEFFAPWRITRRADDYTGTDYASDQLQLYNLLPLHNAGFKGQGILMTVCDGGFYNANTMACFDQKTKELGHFDFTDDTDDFYGSTGTHGTECLSTIAAKAGNYTGSAPEATYYLMRSEEVETESPKEMDNLVAALEKADSLGVNIFSVSLGYAIFDNDSWTLPKSALDGRTTRVSRAATIAARKGMLVCVAAGNEGDMSWRTISAPADADSILTVGAVNTAGEIGDFSSYGPSADKRIKPEVCAVGVAASLIRPDGYIIFGNGTSFATPLIAGMAACLWSALPDENAMQIRDRIIRSADHYLTPDTTNYHSGYGIPNAWKAYKGETPEGLTAPSVLFYDRPLDARSGKALHPSKGEKVLRNGILYILRDGKIYDMLGRGLVD